MHAPFFLRPWQTRTHCCGHIVADTNVSPFARARNICCGHKICVRDTKVLLILFRNILCPQQMLPSLRSPRNIMSSNVSATMCPRLPGPLSFLPGKYKFSTRVDTENTKKVGVCVCVFQAEKLQNFEKGYTRVNLGSQDNFSKHLMNKRKDFVQKLT